CLLGLDQHGVLDLVRQRNAADSIAISGESKAKRNNALKGNHSKVGAVIHKTARPEGRRKLKYANQAKRLSICRVRSLVDYGLSACCDQDDQVIRPVPSINRDSPDGEQGAAFGHQSANIKTASNCSLDSIGPEIPSDC